MSNPAQARAAERLKILGARPRPLTDYATANLADAMWRIGLGNRVLDHAIRPLLPFRKLVGQAVTARLVYSEKPGGHSKVYQEAYESARGVASPIMVIESPRDAKFGTFGSGSAYVARHGYGFVGCILEGGLRDSDDLARMDFQAYSRFISPEHEPKKVIGHSANEPVAVGGVTIRPGDIIVGDNDGVVVIRPDEFERVIQATNEDLQTEMAVIQAIEAGMPFVDIVRKFQPHLASESGEMTPASKRVRVPRARPGDGRRSH